MSEEITENQGAVSGMDPVEFEARLRDFFTHHKESKLRLVPRIVEEFAGKEALVLEHLHNKYVLGIVTEKPAKPPKAHTEVKSASSGAAGSSAEETKPKSKKKLIIIIIVAFVVIALGVTGFLMKDKILGKHGEPAKTEVAPAESTTPPAEEPKKEEAPVETTQTDSVPAATPDSASAGTETTKSE